MQVVENQYNGHLPGCLMKELPDGVERTESGRARVHRAARQLLSAWRTEQFLQQGPDIIGRGSHVEAYLVRRGSFHVGAQDLDPRPIRWGAAFFATASPQNQGSLVLRHVRQYLGTMSLADSR